MQQYIDLYNEHREAFHRDAPAALNALRERALQVVATTPLPPRGSDDHEAIDLPEMFATDYGLNVSRLNIDPRLAESFHCDVPNLSTALWCVAGDVPRPTATALRPMPGVDVMTLRQAGQRCPELLEQYLGRAADISQPVVALNTLLAQDGLLIHVHEGVTCPKPIQLVNILNATAPMMAVRRLLVVADSGANVKLLLCDHTQRDGVPMLSLQVTEVFACEGATIDVYDLEEATAATRRVNASFVSQSDNSNVLVDTITLSGGTTRNEITVDANGPGTETHLLGMAIADGSQTVDNRTLIRHHAPRCDSNEMYKYVLDDKAVGGFEGRIRVDEGCPRVEAYQGNRNLLAAATARMHTKPQLEIYTDDVRCSHGTTIGQLDDDALFYMQSRGIPRDTARTMLMQAFMADVIDAVRLDVLRDRLRHLVDKRFAGQLASCAKCPIQSHRPTID